MPGFSLGHLVLVLVVVLIVFGAGKLPKVMGDIAKGVRAFRDGMREQEDVAQDPKKLHAPSDDPQAKK